jgi:hypothetical protein
MSHINSLGSTGGSTPSLITYKYTAVSTTPYVVLPTDAFLGVDTSTLAITIDLPNAPVTGRVYIVKDTTGNALIHNVTVTTVGGTVIIDSAATFLMNTAYQSASFLFNGTKYLIF